MERPQEGVLGNAAVTSRGRLTIPAAVLRAAGIDAGDQVVFEALAGGVLLGRAPRASDLLGVAPPMPGDWKAIRQQAWADRAVRLTQR